MRHNAAGSRSNASSMNCSRLFDLAPRRSFRLVGEQIDGSFHLASATYLLEAKWHDIKIGNHELQAFAGSVRSKAIWSRGLYVSNSGFSGDGLEAFARGDATRIICVAGFDLWQIIEQQLDLSEALSLKTRRGRLPTVCLDQFHQIPNLHWPHCVGLRPCGYGRGSLPRQVGKLLWRGYSNRENSDAILPVLLQNPFNR